MAWNPKPAAWYGNNMSSIIMPNAGTIYYVDGTNGSNANEGLSRDEPFLTITYALSQCTAGNEDYIIVIGYPSAGAAGEVWPIAISVANVHLIGDSLYQASPSAWLDPPADTAAITVGANFVEIAGLELRGGATSACLDSDGTTWRAYIHHNDFGFQSGAQDGIRIGVGSADCPHWLIEHNKFGHLANITRDAIRIEHNSTRSVIRDNYFYVNSGCVGIHFQGLCTAVGYVLDNTFKVADAANGEAIYIENVNAAVCQFHGNRVASGNIAMANNPFRDLGADCHWGVNYAGTAVTLPVTV